jgi:hypothetical protein
MMIIRARVDTRKGFGRHSMSMVFDNGDIHHFFALHDGVHHSYTRQFRGRYPSAINRELTRPNAEVLPRQADWYDELMRDCNIPRSVVEANARIDSRL